MFLNNEDISSKEKKIITEDIKNSNNPFTLVFGGFFEKLFTTSSEIVKEMNSKIREIHRRIDSIIKELQEENEITEIDKILNLCPDEKIKEQVLDYIIEHNNEIYVNLAAELETLKMKSDDNLKKLFCKYGFFIH